MEDGRYIRTMLQAVAVKEEGKEISPTEAKKLAENLVVNRKNDVLVAKAIRAKYELSDFLREQAGS